MSDTATQYAYSAPYLKNERTACERIEKFISSHHFLDYNLRGRLFNGEESVIVYHAGFSTKSVPFQKAVNHLESKGQKVNVGFAFGPTWTVHWFKVYVKVPTEWLSGKIALFFETGCEGLIWSSAGNPLEGLSSSAGRNYFLISSDKEIQEFYIEMSANERNGDGDGGAIEPTNLDKSFTIKKAHISRYNRDVHELLIDFELLLETSQVLPKDGIRRYEALYTANYLINCIIESDFSEECLKDVHARAMEFFTQSNGFSQMSLYVMGNCHIDTAWLWRFEETKRKCARSWTNALSLLKKNPKMNFVISQGQQLAWISAHYPQIYKELKDFSKKDRLFGVGGTWVEMDGNIPNGESMIRQILYGHSEFRKLFDHSLEILWLPDTFGFCGQLPQIMKHCKMKYFLTQKMSWCLVNKFPHSSFYWAGIDGSEILAHFPPSSYDSQIKIKECVESVTNFNDRGRSKIAMMLYGHGDGGGGPDEDMLMRAERLADCDGIPKIVHSTPHEFFNTLIQDSMNLCTWRGELYLELHNGTYTTQAELKKMNRLVESLLRDQEFLQSIILLEKGIYYSLETEWKQFLLNQFHDILPGTCIKEVVDDALDIYNKLVDGLSAEGGKILKVVENNFDMYPGKQDWILNSCGWNRVFPFENGFVEVPPFTIVRASRLSFITPTSSRKCLEEYMDDENRKTFTMLNQYLTATINEQGRISSLLVKNKTGINYEAITSGASANRFVIYDDVPLFWDAWDVMDYHLETRKTLFEATSSTVIENTNIRAIVRFKIPISDTSHIVQDISLRWDLPYLEFHTVVHWYESHKFLKVEFPVNINNTDAYYEIPFGFIKRPTVRNTSWDSAKYEVCGHKWMALEEYNRGVAILNDCKYGHSCLKNILQLSLLRASKSPDRSADMGVHKFSYALYPYFGSLQSPSNDTRLSVVRAAFDFNNPVRQVLDWSCGDRAGALGRVYRIFDIQGSEGVFVSSLKGAEKFANALVIRLYESFGGAARIKFIFNHRSIIRIEESNGLEARGLEITLETENLEGEEIKYAHFNFRPFEIKTYLIFCKTT